MYNHHSYILREEEFNIPIKIQLIINHKIINFKTLLELSSTITPFTINSRNHHSHMLKKFNVPMKNTSIHSQKFLHTHVINLFELSSTTISSTNKTPKIYGADLRSTRQTYIRWNFISQIRLYTGWMTENRGRRFATWARNSHAWSLGHVSPIGQECQVVTSWTTGCPSILSMGYMGVSVSFRLRRHTGWISRVNCDLLPSALSSLSPWFLPSYDAVTNDNRVLHRSRYFWPRVR